MFRIFLGVIQIRIFQIKVEKVVGSDRKKERKRDKRRQEESKEGYLEVYDSVLYWLLIPRTD